MPASVGGIHDEVEFHKRLVDRVAADHGGDSINLAVAILLVRVQGSSESHGAVLRQRESPARSRQAAGFKAGIVPAAADDNAGRCNVRRSGEAARGKKKRHTRYETQSNHAFG